MVDSQKLDFILENMATKDDIAELESSLLTEIDTVQEKANNHFVRVEKKLDLLEHRMSNVEREVKSVNVVTQAIVDLQTRVAVIERKIS